MKNAVDIKSEKIDSPAVASIPVVESIEAQTFEDLQKRNAELLASQATLKNKLLEQQRAIATFLRTIDKKEAELCGVNIELAALKDRFKLTQRSLKQFKENSQRALDTGTRNNSILRPLRKLAGSADNNIVSILQKKVDILRPKMAALNELAHTDITDLLDKTTKHNQFVKLKTEDKIEWISITRALPRKTGLFLVSDGNKTELSYFNKSAGSFTTKTFKIVYWTDKSMPST